MINPVDPKEVRELYSAVGLGIDAVAFLKTDIGRYLLNKAEEDRTDALADLVDVDPSNTEQIRALQSIIKRADSFQFWISEAIEAGKNAEATLIQGEQDQ
jgi:hypothetical protein